MLTPFTIYFQSFLIVVKSRIAQITLLIAMWWVGVVVLLLTTSKKSEGKDVVDLMIDGSSHKQQDASLMMGAAWNQRKYTLVRIFVSYQKKIRTDDH